MAIPKKGARLIVVEGFEYRWRIRRRPTHRQACEFGLLCVGIELATGSGSVLVVEMAQLHPSAWLGFSAVGVKPSNVAAAIRNALAVGWEPTQPGGTFHLSLN